MPQDEGHLQPAFPGLMPALPNFFVCRRLDGDPARILQQQAC